MESYLIGQGISPVVTDHRRRPPVGGASREQAIGLLHRMTGVPCAELRRGIDQLSGNARDRIDTLAQEILEDVRNISGEEAARRLASD